MPGSSKPACEETVTLAADLHARPAGQLSVAAAKFSADVRLAVGGAAADAKSVLAVMQLGASKGQQVTVRAEGPDAKDAVGALVGILSAVSEASGE